MRKEKNISLKVYVNHRYQKIQKVKCLIYDNSKAWGGLQNDQEVKSVCGELLIFENKLIQKISWSTPHPPPSAYL